MGMQKTVHESGGLLNRVFEENLFNQERNVAPEFDPRLIGSLSGIISAFEVLISEKRKLTPVMFDPFRTMPVEIIQLFFEDHVSLCLGCPVVRNNVPSSSVTS